MVNIDVKSRSKSLIDFSTDELEPSDNVAELIRLISEANNNKSIHRIRLTQLVDGKQVPLPVDEKLIDAGVSHEAKSVQFFAKDLGPQLSWRLVYVVEYLGPLLIHPLFYYIATTYGVGFGPYKPTQTQKFAVWLAFLHFLKREIETIYLHVFSNATMPASFIFRNSAHYWILGGLLISVFSYATPAVSPSANFLTRFLFHTNDFPAANNWALTLAWTVCELSNFKAHKTLADLRKKDPKKYAIPYGYGFDLVSCPNYFFEILGWTVYSVLIGNWSLWVFLATGGFTMFAWAVKRHKKYLKTFGDDYKKLKRNVIFPYVY